MNKKKILLLNPPHKNYCMRDYYCSKLSKAAYYYHPVDFIILSGILSQKFDVVLIDCEALSLGAAAALVRISAQRPDVVIFLSGAASLETDFVFLADVERITRAVMIGIGDIFLDYAPQILEAHPFIDACLLDFTTDDVVKFVDGGDSGFDNIVYRRDRRIHRKEERHTGSAFSIPMPRHELFLNGRYVFPFARQRPFSTVLTDFGCPFGCSYCVVNRFGYKERPVADVIAELKYLTGIGVREAVFKDQTFAADPARAGRLCRAMIDENIGIGWTCFSRTDLMSGELLSLMKKAGCHTIIFGVESSNSALMSSYGRMPTDGSAAKTVDYCKELGLETVLTFILGLPGDGIGSIEQTISLAKKLMPDYASFNIFTPACGTKIRAELIRDGLIEDKVSFMDSGIGYPVTVAGSLSPADIWALRRKAVLGFYFTPSYILNRLSKCRNIPAAANMLRQAAGILRSLL
jgi:radical SAM superfamily enzyme YgiQ (UPF0313 family)